MEESKLRGLLDIRFLQHKHMDDIELQHSRRIVVVAVMGLRLDRCGSHPALSETITDISPFILVGYSIAACFVCLTGRIAAKYHISFPVVCRSSFGIWGSLWPVLNRAGMACVWYGVQSWIGGTCVYLMIRSIWPSWDSYGPGGKNNTLPASSGTNTRDFVSFFLFWLGSLPFLWPPVQKIRHLFSVKAVVVPIAGIAFFIWAIVRANGIGPIVHQGATIGGSKLAWVNYIVAIRLEY